MVNISYVTAAQTRVICGITTSECSDTDLTTLITYSTRRLNKDIQVKVIREDIVYIDLTRQNLINGSNTTFYIKNWKNYFLGDANDDGSVTTADITVYQVAQGGAETSLTVSSIDETKGSFTLSTAPAAGVKLYTIYFYSPVSMSTPDGAVQLACAYLTASMASLKIDVRKAQQFATGKMRVTRQSEGYKIWYEKYTEVLNEIRSRPFVQEKTDDLVKIVRPGFLTPGFSNVLPGGR